MGHGEPTRAQRPAELRRNDQRPTLVVQTDTASSGPWGNSDAVSFGPYRVFERLGMGGMATVHRAERRDGVRQRVALKRLMPHLAQDPENVQMFLHEAELVLGLRHRNIAAVYDAGCIEREYFLAMEHVTGPSLKQLQKTSAETVGLIPFPIVLSLLAQICDGLAHAHDHKDKAGRPLGIVHRDVSPSNIVISANGIVKLIDFGIAKTIATETQAGIVKGKLGYVAPEYLNGSIDRRADLWAVGVIAWELLTNCRLFTADEDLVMIRNVLSQPIDPPSVHNPDVPPELDAIVMTALSRDPDQRWQNAGALRTALLQCAKPSSNGELVEWVEWMFKLAERGLRPARGSRPLPAMKAMKFTVPMPGMVAVPNASLPAPMLPIPAPPPDPTRSARIVERVSRPMIATAVVTRPKHRPRTGWWIMALLLCMTASALAVLFIQLP